MKILTEVIGMSKSKAVATIRKQGLRDRITREDLTHYIVTMDLRSDRINLELDKNKVTKATIG